MDEQQLTDALAAEQAKRDAVKAEREAQLRMMLENRSALVDTTPTAALFDSLYGGQNVKGALAVQGAAKDQDDVLNKLIFADSKPVSGPVDDSAKLARQDKVMSDKEAAKSARQEDAQTLGAFEKVGVDFGKERKALDEYTNQLAGIDNAIASGSYERIKGQLSNFARAVNAEKGVLTDTDLGRTFIDTLDTIFVRFSSKFDKSGKLRPEDLENLKTAIADSKSQTSKLSSKRLMDKRDSYNSNPTYAKAIAQHESAGKTGLIGGTLQALKDLDSKTAPAPAASPISVDAIKAEMERRKKN